MGIMACGRNKAWVHLASFVGLALLPAACPPLLAAGTDAPPAARAPRTVSLFAAVGEERTGYDALAPRAVRYRSVRINPEVSRPDGVAVGDRLAITPFAGQSFTATVDRVNLDVNNILSVRGRIGDQREGYVLISFDGARALGSLEIPEEDVRYAIVPGPDPGIQLLQEPDPNLDRPLEDAPPLMPPAQARRTAAVRPAAAAGKTKIDVMLVYTPSARSWASSRGGIHLVMAQITEKGQLAFDNSQVDIALRFVHSALVDYQEVEPYLDVARLLQGADGYMDEVHTLRNDYGADVVSLLETTSQVGGLGYGLPDLDGRADWAFTLVSISASADTTLVHEIGHNMGLHHRIDQEVSPGPGIFPYSAGWRWLGNDNTRYCSVMSYSDAWAGQPVFRVPYFSSPLIQYQGAATGHAELADNARTLRETKATVSGYRPALAMLTIKATTGGTTSPAPGNAMFRPGDQASVTALPETHFTLLRWSGDAAGATNPLTLRMDDDKTVTAHFQRILYPPQNARGERVLNRSLSQVEYINVLRWETHPNNVNVTGYKVYLVESGQRTPLTTVDAATLVYWHRNVDKSKTYVYEILATNSEPREGLPAAVTVR